MKIPLRIGATDVLLTNAPFGGKSVFRFSVSDKHSALNLLRHSSNDPVAMAMIRRQAQDLHLEVSRLTDPQVLELIAQQIADGNVRISRPQVVERKFFNVLVTAKEEKEEKGPDHEGKKWPPDPLVPPEYILMAWLESNEIKKGRDYIVTQLEALLHGLIDLTLPASVIAPEYTNAANIGKAELENIAATINTQLAGYLFDKLELIRPKSIVAPEYRTAARVNSQAIVDTVQSFSADLFGLVGG